MSTVSFIVSIQKVLEIRELLCYTCLMIVGVCPCMHERQLYCRADGAGTAEK